MNNYRIEKPHFTMKYGEELIDSFKLKGEAGENSFRYVLDDGLIITTSYVTDEENGVIWWTNRFENPTDHESKIISELWDGNIDIPFDPDPVLTRRNPHHTMGTDRFVLLETNGANQSENDGIPLGVRLSEGEEPHLTKCEQGRSGMTRLPYFELKRQDKGALIAIGWTGQWNAYTTRFHDCANFRCGLETTHFKMLPGEKFRTASVAVLHYENGSDEAHNRWRRFMAKISPLGGKGRGEQCPFSAIFWGGIPSDELIDRWKAILEAKLPFDTCWIDAGWYEPLSVRTRAEQMRDWQQIGLWEVSKAYHPDGYQDVIDYLHKNGIGFMVWFEPERMKTEIGMWTKFLWHPETRPLVRLVDLGDDSACDDLIKKIGDMVEYLQLSVYRQDYNIFPLPYWRYNETEDRKGAVEIRYINNLYRFWDALLERFPHLLIDNCAGGGHRNDIEMLSRSVPLWRSDYQTRWDCLPEANQVHNECASLWMPYSGIGFGPSLGDTYNFRSAYSNGMTVRTWEHADPEWNVGATNEPLDWAKKYFDEFNSIRNYFAKDFYMLIEPSLDSSTWQATQYHDTASDSGIILAFRRENSPFEFANVQLHGLDSGKMYRLENADTGDTVIISGAQMMSEHFTLRIPGKRESGLWRYS